MSDLVTCGECGTRYDSDHDAFCPRCGSLAKGQVVPAAVALAHRRDPLRRRVQASGILLMAVGGLFLASALIATVATSGDLPPEFAQVMASQPGGTLVLTSGSGNVTATVAWLDGTVLREVRDEASPVEVDLGGHASATVRAGGNGTAGVNVTVIVLDGDRLELDVDAARDGAVVGSGSLRALNRVALGIAFAFTGLLLAGGLAAVALRWWGLAAAGAIAGAFVGLLALFFFLVAGLLFAVPFGFAAYFILRGRRQFRSGGDAGP